jgi:hypothetical protein
MASMKRIKTELLALGFATATMALFADHTPAQKYRNSSYLADFQARAESALYLDGPATQARVDRTTGRWAVTDGQTTAWLDARSGDLLEIEFRAPR